MALCAQCVGEHLHERSGGEREELRIRGGGGIDFLAPRGGDPAAFFDGLPQTFSELGRFDGGRLARHECEIHSTHNKWLTNRCCTWRASLRASSSWAPTTAKRTNVRLIARTSTNLRSASIR